MSSQFRTLSDVLHSGMATPAGPFGKVEISKIHSGHSESPARPTMSLKYVAAGVELYRYSGRTHRVEGGSFLVLPEGHHGEAMIDRRHGVAIGMCVFLPERGGPKLPAAKLDAPLSFSADCSALGQMLARTHKLLLRSPDLAPAISRRLLFRIGEQIEPFLVDTVRTIDGLQDFRPATRYETMRRLNLARAYLHAVDDRPVGLAELGRHAGVSRYQLARSFAECFGSPPARYHRRLRLDRARDQITARQLTCTEAAYRYGFSDVAHFSRAYRSAFGQPPSADQT